MYGLPSYDKPMHVCLFYETAPDYLERRQPYRAEHLALINAFHSQGKIVMAGALKPGGALLVFQADTIAAARADAEAFAAQDPYLRHGVATAWSTKEWTVVTGA